MAHQIAEPGTLSERAVEIRDAARHLLESEGPDGLVIRRLCDRLGVQAPTIYRRFVDKRALEDAIVSQAFWEFGAVLAAAIEGAEDPLAALTTAARDWARAHPHLYRLIYGRELGPSIDRAAERFAGEPLRSVAGGDLDAARAVWAFAHGMIILELDNRFPEDSDLDAIWRFGIEGLRGGLAAS
jgi:AcrR family transcriptional regulator